MFRFNGWRFLTMGRALERADQTLSLLIAFADLGAPSGGFDVAIEVGDSAMSHRRRYSVETNRNTVIDLLVLDIGNPRSVLFQIEVLREQESLLSRPDDERCRMSPLARRILLLHTELSVAAPEELTTERLIGMQAEVRQISGELTDCYLS